MNKEKILELYNDPSINAIYGFMFGRPFLHSVTPQGGFWKRDKVIKISKESLKLSKNEDAFFYIWGWPGPDYNKYCFDDYGKTWVFADKELIDET